MPDDEDSLDIPAIYQRMQRIEPGCKYYMMTLVRSRTGHPLIVLYWSYYQRYSPRRGRPAEVRRAGTVDAKWITSVWKPADEWTTVYSEADAIIFLWNGGHAFIEQGFGDTRLPDILGPMECVLLGPDTGKKRGFIATEHLPDSVFKNRVARGALRREVLDRDGHRCLLCGRTQGCNPDFELEVHHVIPFRHGGPTTAWNLATLCRTCHRLRRNQDYVPELRKVAGLPGPSIHWEQWEPNTVLLPVTSEITSIGSSGRSWPRFSGV